MHRWPGHQRLELVPPCSKKCIASAFAGDMASPVALHCQSCLGTDTCLIAQLPLPSHTLQKLLSVMARSYTDNQGQPMFLVIAPLIGRFWSALHVSLRISAPFYTSSAALPSKVLCVNSPRPHHLISQWTEKQGVQALPDISSQMSRCYPSAVFVTQKYTPRHGKVVDFRGLLLTTNLLDA